MHKSMKSCANLQPRAQHFGQLRPQLAQQHLQASMHACMQGRQGAHAITWRGGKMRQDDDSRRCRSLRNQSVHPSIHHGHCHRRRARGRVGTECKVGCSRRHTLQHMLFAAIARPHSFNTSQAPPARARQATHSDRSCCGWRTSRVYMHTRLVGAGTRVMTPPTIPFSFGHY